MFKFIQDLLENRNQDHIVKEKLVSIEKTCFDGVSISEKEGVEKIKISAETKQQTAELKEQEWKLNHSGAFDEVLQSYLNAGYRVTSEHTNYVEITLLREYRANDKDCAWKYYYGEIKVVRLVFRDINPSTWQKQRLNRILEQDFEKLCKNYEDHHSKTNTSFCKRLKSTYERVLYESIDLGQEKELYIYHVYPKEFEHRYFEGTFQEYGWPAKEAVCATLESIWIV